LLTMFYQGLFDLAKQFLDPYDNENYGRGHDPLCVDTLIAETNAGSIRWMNGFEFQPWSAEMIRTGEMDALFRPTRGYSVKDLEAKEEAAELERLRQEEEQEAMLDEESNALAEQDVETESIESDSDDTEDDSTLIVQARKGMSDLRNLMSEIVVNNTINGSEKSGETVNGSKESAGPEEGSIISEGSSLEHLTDSSRCSDESPEDGNADEDVLPQIVVEEAVEEEGVAEEEEEVIGPITAEDYAKETAEIIAAAEREAMETEAIMNAPPGADSVEGLNDDDDEDEHEEDNQDTDKIGQAVANAKEPSSKVEIDTAAVYESAKERMLKDLIDDADFEVSRDELSRRAEEIIGAAEEELLETQAILNASPGADSVDICDSDDTDCISSLGNSIPLDTILPSAELDLAADMMAGELKERIVQNSFLDLEVLEMDKKNETIS